MISSGAGGSVSASRLTFSNSRERSQGAGADGNACAFQAVGQPLLQQFLFLAGRGGPNVVHGFQVFLIKTGSDPDIHGRLTGRGV